MFFPMYASHAYNPLTFSLLGLVFLGARLYPPHLSLNPFLIICTYVRSMYVLNSILFYLFLYFF